jgi:tetratricopeptide (TPR) repeat protein
MRIDDKSVAMKYQHQRETLDFGFLIRRLQSKSQSLKSTIHILPVLAILLCAPVLAQPPIFGQGQIPVKPEEVSDAVFALIERGDALAKAKRYDEAIEQYKAAIAKAGKPLFTAYLNLGSVYYSKENIPAAIEAFRKTIEIRPNDYQGHYNLAESLYVSGDYRNSETEYRRVIALIPDGIVSTEARYFLGLALHKQGRADEAMVQYRAAIERAGGKYAEAHYNLGTALLERKDYQEAEREFRTSIEQDKTFKEAYFNLAVALENQRRIREAIEQYEIYVGLTPDSSDAANLRARIERLKKQ